MKEIEYSGCQWRLEDKAQRITEGSLPGDIVGDRGDGRLKTVTDGETFLTGFLDETMHKDGR